MQELILEYIFMIFARGSGPRLIHAAPASPVRGRTKSAKKQSRCKSDFMTWIQSAKIRPSKRRARAAMLLHYETAPHSGIRTSGAKRRFLAHLCLGADRSLAAFSICNQGRRTCNPALPCRLLQSARPKNLKLRAHPTAIQAKYGNQL